MQREAVLPSRGSPAGPAGVRSDAARAMAQHGRAEAFLPDSGRAAKRCELVHASHRPGPLGRRPVPGGTLRARQLMASEWEEGDDVSRRLAGLGGDQRARASRVNPDCTRKVSSLAGALGGATAHPGRRSCRRFGAGPHPVHLQLEGRPFGAHGGVSRVAADDAGRLPDRGEVRPDHERSQPAAVHFRVLVPGAAASRLP